MIWQRNADILKLYYEIGRIDFDSRLKIEEWIEQVRRKTRHQMNNN